MVNVLMLEKLHEFIRSEGRAIVSVNAAWESVLCDQLL